MPEQDGQQNVLLRQRRMPPDIHTFSGRTVRARKDLAMEKRQKGHLKRPTLGGPYDNVTNK